MNIRRYLISGIRSLKNDGIKVTVQKVKNVISRQDTLKILKNSYFISDEVRIQQTQKKFENPVTFSIVVPLYNTPEKYLKEMIESVVHQTYCNWELCLADGSEGDSADTVKRYCLQRAEEDSRIKYKKLEKNEGISGNTNAALDMATGEYIGIFDHDDLLHPSALYEMMCTIEKEAPDYLYTDEATFEKSVKNIVNVHFKPDYGLDTLRANNYICHFSVFKKSLLEQVGKFRKEYDGSQDHDMILRLTQVANKVHHIPKLLYFWRSHPASVAENIGAKTYAIDAGIKAVKDSIVTYGEKAEVESSKAFPTIYRIKYELHGKPLISIMVPCRDKADYTERCVMSILEKSSYENYEILLIDNNSKEATTWECYQKLQENSKVRVVLWNKEFNFSAINNFASKEAKGEILVLLNNDTEVINEEWMEEMLMYAQRADVGIVGAKLYYDDDTIQHAGVLLGVGADRVAGHAHYRQSKENLGYMGRLYYAQNLSAVTGACMMIRKDVYEKAEGFDEDFAVAYNDVDFCMRVRKLGYSVVFTPYAELYHYESKSRGMEDTDEKKIRFQKEANLFKKRWKEELEQGDPYYNPNFDLDKDDFTVGKLQR